MSGRFIPSTSAGRAGLSPGSLDAELPFSFQPIWTQRLERLNVSGGVTTKQRERFAFLTRHPNAVVLLPINCGHS